MAGADSPHSPGRQPWLLLAGPTAVGKSELALQLAELLDGEIVSVDSMQVYRGLDVGTAKPSPAERRRVPHHLIDVVALNETFDAAQFARLAHQAVGEIQRRGRQPILCGGSGLYFRAFLEGLGEAPAPSPALRAELEATPLPALLEELAQRDPVTFQQIDRQNPRRIVRALEVIRLTGKPFSPQKAAWPRPAVLRPGLRFFGLCRESGDLRARIEARVAGMFQRGLVAETRQLLARGLSQNLTARQAIGYRQVIEHLQGEHSLATTMEQVKIRTRQLARRQLTWFRHQARLEWIALAPADPVAAVAERIAAELRVKS